jgi:hypothetical protein
MSDRKLEIDAKIIHPRALRTLGLEACIVMLDVAHDLREDRIEHFDMRSYFSCGSPCCICGHVLYRLGYGCDEKNPDYTSRDGYDLRQSWFLKDKAVFRLFSANAPSDPQLAARAIDRYVLEGAESPWR